MSNRIMLLIPCYNEEKRLKLNEFIQYSNICDFIFINDGSTDQTLKTLESIKSNNIKILNLPNNIGKSAAIHQGYLYFKNLDNYNLYQWIGFWDADLATPLNQVMQMLKFSEIKHDVKSVWGSRILCLGSHIQRNFFRHLMGRFFATLAYLILKIKSYDSQCGAKLFKTEIAEDIFSNKFITKWIFDIEILIRLNLNNHKVIEYPIEKWADVKGSKLNPFFEIFRTIIDLFRIKNYYKIN